MPSVELRDTGRLLTPGEAVALLGVSRSTVIRRAKRLQLSPVRTAGGHRRWREADVRLLMLLYSQDGGAAR